MSGSSEQNPSDQEQTFPVQGRLLGLDYGTKRVGIAVSTYEQNIASPLENFTRQSEEHDGLHYSKLVKEYTIVGLVVGLPIHLSGEESQKSREAREFGSWIANVTGLPVCFWDERFTSAMAEEHLMAAELSKKKRKNRLDKLASQIMLQSFLDAIDREQIPGEY
ncbi:MAG: Holliday junction resolvase RuvX [Planctomycetes bacterium]|nr:Holliday junction resolvase RuvX [Planctomycetota bacterium]